MRRRSDFILVELAIVIAIFFVFAAAAKLLVEAHDRPQRICCAGNLKRIGAALQMYANDNRDRFPAGPSFAGGHDNVLTEKDFYTAGGRAGGFELLRTNEYLSDYGVYVCPPTSTVCGRDGDSLSWSHAGSGSGKANVSYAYLPGLAKGDGVRTARPASGICADLTGDVGVDSNGGASNHAKFGNILYLDGHVRSYAGHGWFSPENAGYPGFRPGTAVMTPNTLRDAGAGKE